MYIKDGWKDPEGAAVACISNIARVVRRRRRRFGIDS